MTEIATVRQLVAQRVNPSGPPPVWAEQRREMNEAGASAPLAEGWAFEAASLGQVAAERHFGPDMTPNASVLYLHGGGYVVGSPQSYRGLISQIAAAATAETFAIDYRLAPEHPFPAALDDAFAAYQDLLAARPGSAIAVAGDSAGGGLALALALRLRDEGKPAPAALFIMSPWADLTLSGPSLTRRADYDPMLSANRLRDYCQAYIPAGVPADHPYLSPALADLSNLPDILVQVGTDEVLLSDAERVQDRAAAAGTQASLEVWPSMIHVFQVFYPLLTPARDAIADAGGWLKRRWAQG